MYESYKAARNAAWEALIKCGIRTLPVDLTKVAEHYGIALVPYSHCALTQAFSPEVISGDGFIASVTGKKIIFLNDKKGTRARRRFTVGHELGHGILGHPLDIIKYRNTETDNPKSLFEFEANIFARDLLAPASVLAALDIHTPEEIMLLCDISRKSAEIRAQRLQLLYQRGMFGTHHLERKLLNQFQEYIVEHAKNGSQ